MIAKEYSKGGMGQLTLDSIQLRDYTQVRTRVLFITCTFVFLNHIIQLSSGLLDPRIRYS